MATRKGVLPRMAIRWGYQGLTLVGLATRAGEIATHSVHVLSLPLLIVGTFYFNNRGNPLPAPNLDEMA